MPCKTKDIDEALVKKGFTKREGDHHFYEFIYKSQKTALRTKISHSHKEISDQLIAHMSRQLQLVKKEFLSLIACPLSEEDYVQLMKTRGFL